MTQLFSKPWRFKIHTPMSRRGETSPFYIRDDSTEDSALDAVAKHMEGVWLRSDLSVEYPTP